MPRKGWESLTPTYRRRLERGGITKQKYEQGVSIKHARGHGRTPEHPIKPGKPIDKKYLKWYNSRYKKPIKMLSSDGEVWLTGVSPRQRSLIGSHWNAIHSSLWDIPMPQGWWWTGNYMDNLLKFSRYRIKGIEVNNDGSFGEPRIWKFMVSFNDAVDWAYADTASFNNIYQLVAS